MNVCIRPFKNLPWFNYSNHSFILFYERDASRHERVLTGFSFVGELEAGEL